MPSFFVFAGPNGSGKSTLSKSLLETFGFPDLTAFDWDAEFNALFSKYFYDPAVMGGIRDFINQKFENAVDSALSQKKDFAFETNFHSDRIMEIVAKAKTNGYNVNLVFLYMESVTRCEERVRSRVEMGGHNVSKDDIQKRFSAGLDNLKSFYRKFDTTYIYNTTEDWKTSLALSVSAGKILQKEPGATLEFFKKILPGLETEKG